MRAMLPDELQDVFARFVTTEYVTVDEQGQPIVWPVTPYFHSEEGCIDVTTGLGYPKKAHDAARNPSVALLFSDPTGSGLDSPPMVLVQGTAVVDDHDLDANRRRYERESVEKLPAIKDMAPPDFMKRMFNWYYTRIYVHVRPERVYVWPGGDTGAEPELLDAHLEEVRSGHNEEPERPPEHAPGPGVDWDARMDELGDRYRTAVLAVVGPDGFPFAVRVPIRPERSVGVVRIPEEPVGAPLAPGRACLVAHDHAPDFSWQRNFQIRGELAQEGDGWVLAPRQLVGGFELPPGSTLSRYRLNAKKVMRFRKIAKREHARRRR
jgi:hypothetical protein